MGDLWQMLGGAAGGGLGSGLVAVFVWNWFKRLQNRQDAAEREVKNLKDEQIAKLEKIVEKHIENDKSPEILTKLDTLIGSDSKQDDKIDRLDRRSAAHEQKLDNHDLYLRNLNESQQHLRRELGGK